MSLTALNARLCLLLQVWRGSLLLADYLLANSTSVVGIVGCELGAGAGLASIALARAGARRVFATDTGQEVLGLCKVCFMFRLLCCSGLVHAHHSAGDEWIGCTRGCKSDEA